MGAAAREARSEQVKHRGPQEQGNQPTLHKAAMMDNIPSQHRMHRARMNPLMSPLGAQEDNVHGGSSNVTYVPLRKSADGWTHGSGEPGNPGGLCSACNFSMTPRLL